MNLKKYLSTVFTLLSFLLSMTFSTNCQEAFPELDKIIPPSPTASSLGKFADVPVSFYTSTPGISVPLWTVKGRKLSFPVSLSYHASGIRVDDIAGWVGTGWSLNAGGVITRTIRGKADDLQSGYYHGNANGLPSLGNNLFEYAEWIPPGDNDYERNLYLQNIDNGIIDAEPDFFFFNFNGRSGKFVFDTDGNVRILSLQNILINPEFGPDNKIIRWEIIDENGNKYSFGGSDAVETTTPLTINGNPQESFISSWYLKEIQTANNEDDIQLDYMDYNIVQKYPVPHYKGGCTSPEWKDLKKYTQTNIQGKYLSQINYSKGTVIFNTLVISGFNGQTHTALNEILIRAKPTNQTVKKIKFTYSFFPVECPGCDQDYLGPTLRLRLDKVRELSGDGNSGNPPTRFFYNETPLPPRGSFSQDHWGYYNGAENEFLIPSIWVQNHKNINQIPPYIESPLNVNYDKLMRINLVLPNTETNVWELAGANREPDPAFMKAGILERIVWPTGGTTVFEYEPHDFGFVSKPPKPNQEIQTAYWDNIHQDNIVQKIFNVSFPQEVKITTLFYIIQGIKNPGEDPSVNSRILIKTKPGVSPAETFWSYSFGDTPENYTADATFPVYLDEGEYMLEVISADSGDLTRAILEYRDSIWDQSIPIYSNEYETPILQAGEEHFIDDSSFYMSTPLVQTGEDKEIINIEFRFHSKLHPNVIPESETTAQFTVVAITKQQNNEQVFKRYYYGDDLVKWDEGRREYYYQGETIFVLEPGQYNIEFIPRIKSEWGWIIVNHEKMVASHNYKTAGGLRVKKILNIDNESDTLTIKKISYRMSDEPGSHSSGVLLSYPVYYDKPDEIYFASEGGISFGDCIPISLYSQGKNALGTTSGSHIGYSEVTVSQPGAGKTVYTYYSPDDNPDISNTSFPFPPVTSYDWKRGMLKEMKIYTENGNIRLKEIYEYNPAGDTTNLRVIPGLKVVQRTPENDGINIYEKYMTVAGWNIQTNKSTTKFDINGNNPVTTKETYTYNPQHLRRIVTETKNSDGSEIKTNFYYPEDLINPPTIIDTLIDWHINSLVKSETFINDNRIRGKEIRYKTFHNPDRALPFQTKELEGESYVLKTTFDKYDEYSNLLQFHREDDIYHSFNWDNLNNYPIAEIVNSEYKTELTGYSEEARITRYTYQPLIGIGSVTDPNNVSTYYTYDPMGRLTTIFNQDHHIIKQTDYSFKTFPGDTTINNIPPKTPDYSASATGISASINPIASNCVTTLTVTGGDLADDAEWHWYTDHCAMNYIGTGESVNVSPDETTTYYVRAEGAANNTTCTALTINVSQVSFNPSPGSLNYPIEGTGGHPQPVATIYNGCDAWEVSENMTWITLVKEDLSFRVTCETNHTLDTRNGNINLSGNGTNFYIPVTQQGLVPLEASLSYTSDIIYYYEEITVTANITGGVGPFTYRWEERNDGVTDWTYISEETTSNRTSSTDSLTINNDTYFRCTVNSEYQSVTKTTILIRFIPDYSESATDISASLNPIGSSCVTTLSVNGGHLGENAEWHWYSGNCAENLIGTGVSVNVAPAETTTYFVRAEGTANYTTCVSKTINITPASFNPSPGSLDFTYEGIAGAPMIILTNYNACDQWEVSENMDWITTVKEDLSFRITCEPNYTLVTRSGNINLSGGGENVSIPITQQGLVQLEASLSYTSDIIYYYEEITVTANITGGVGPFTYRWEERNDGVTDWTYISEETTSNRTSSTDSLTINNDTYFRCTVNSEYQSVTKTTILIRFIPDYSESATDISASLNPIGSSCVTTLSVNGGHLGENAEWHWYSGNCAENLIGTGVSVNVAPAETTTYFVRAEGTANYTTCVSKTINITPASFNPSPGSLDFTYEGIAGAPMIILTNYNACDQWEVSENMDWITTVKEDLSFRITCEPNYTLVTRSGNINLSGGGENVSIPVTQQGLVQLEANLSYTPAIVYGRERITVTANVTGGVGPYTYRWEERNDGVSDWTYITEETTSNRTSSIATLIGNSDVYFRCRVTSEYQEITETILVRLFEDPD